MIGVGVAVLAVAVGLVLFALRDSIVFFHTPSDVADKPIPPASASASAAWSRRAREARRGHQGSVRRHRYAEDGSRRLQGVLPDLFREGQGVVAEGKLAGGTFLADTVLAKHDENYMPPEVAKALEGEGRLAGRRKAARHGATPSAAGRCGHRTAMIVELGHFALILALLVASCRWCCRRGARTRAMPA